MTKPMIIAHRGLNRLYPENTLLAFEMAAKEGRADAIELDVKLSADGEPVVIHDAKVDRTTNGTGFVCDMTYAELRELDAGSGQKIPHLSEVLETMRRVGLKVNIEIKRDEAPQPELEATVIKLVLNMAMENDVWFSSFDHISMAKCKQITTKIPTALLFRQPLYQAEKYCLTAGVDMMHSQYPLLRYEPDLADRARAVGLKVIGCTVDKSEDLEMVLERRVDGVITNYPERLADMLI